MPVTDRVTLFGYSATEVEKRVEKIKAEFEEKKAELEASVSELKAELETLKTQIEHEKNNKKVVVKKRVVHAQGTESKEQSEIMEALYNAHIKSTERILKVQKNISMTLEKRKSLILIRERKANEMKNDLQNLIDYIDSLAKSY